MHVVFYLLAIFCLIVLSLVLLHIRRGPDYPVRGIFPDKAVNAYMHANGQYHELRYEFATGVRALEGEYMPIIYPDWLNEMGDDLELIWKKMRESLLLLPFTKLYNDALRADEPVQAARVEVKRFFDRALANAPPPKELDDDEYAPRPVRIMPTNPWASVEQQNSQSRGITRPLRRAKLTGSQTPTVD